METFFAYVDGDAPVVTCSFNSGSNPRERFVKRETMIVRNPDELVDTGISIAIEVRLLHPR
jgi:hypothetical protein